MDRIATERDEIDALVAAALAIQPDELQDLENIVKARTLIENAMRVVDETTSRIKAQLDEAKGRVQSYSEYSDPVWWRRVNSASRMRARQRQELQVLLGKVNRMHRQQSTVVHQKSQDRYFVEAAKILLPRDTLIQLWRLAQELKDKQ